MTIRLSEPQLSRFRTDLLAHRETFALNDADYAADVLKISLNTYKKCLQTSGKPLALKRHTFVSIFANAVLDPKNYGLAIGVPSQSSPFGGYLKSEFQHLCGRHFLYRRSFLTARHITRSVLDIHPSENQECLSFKEWHNYTAETGALQELYYNGDIYMNRERSVLSLPAYFEGQVRLTHLLPERVNPKKVRMRGALLAFGNPNGIWQPTVSCIFVEGPIEDKRTSLKDLCTTIPEGSSAYGAFSAELARVEEHATIMTPLMWARSRAKSLID